VTVRPTRDGGVLLVLGGLLGLVAIQLDGSALLALPFSAVCGVVVVDLVLGAWNLRGLEAHRALPPEMFAGEPARGTVRLRAPGTAFGVEVRDTPLHAPVRVGRVAGTAEVDAIWRFGRRGRHRLPALTVCSSYPFKLCWRSQTSAGFLSARRRERSRYPPTGSGV